MAFSDRFLSLVPTFELKYLIFLLFIMLQLGGSQEGKKSQILPLITKIESSFWYFLKFNIEIVNTPKI